MTDKSPKNLQLALTDPGEAGQIVVNLEAFFEFSFWIAEELEDLVARWSCVGAPTNVLNRKLPLKPRH